MNCGLNWSFISCGELHCDSVKIKTMINPNLFFLRRCESLYWSDCLVVLLLSATHFRKSGHARLIRGCFSFSQCFRAGVFSSLSPPPPRSLWLAPFPPFFRKFQHGAFASKLRTQRKRLHCRLQILMKNWHLIEQQPLLSLGRPTDPVERTTKDKGCQFQIHFQWHWQLSSTNDELLVAIGTIRSPRHHQLNLALVS